MVCIEDFSFRSFTSVLLPLMQSRTFLEETKLIFGKIHYRFIQEILLRRMIMKEGKRIFLPFLTLKIRHNI